MKPLDREALEGAKKALRIRDVYFRDERITLNPEVTPHFAPDIATTQFHMTTSIIRDFEVPDAGKDGASMRFVEVEFRGGVRCLAAASGNMDPTEILLLEVNLGLLYAVTQSCPEASLDEFVRMNVPFHAIPYWREHVHGVCCKRRLPPVTVPLYTVLRSQAREDVDAATTSSEESP